MKTGQFILTQYGVKVELDTTPYGAERTYVALDQGFDNLDEALNDVTNEYFFLGDKGFGSSFTTGIHPTYSLSGTRVVGDPAQDYIFDNKFNLMAGRNTNLRISIPRADGSVVRFTNDITLSNMKSFGGGTTDGASVSVDLIFNGAPLVETVSPSTELTIASVFGGKAGFTTLTVSPYYPDAGCKFVYTYGNTAATVAIGDVLIDWNDFTNGNTYEIPDGKVVTVAMVSVATFKVVGFGSATVISVDQTIIDVTSEAGASVGTTKITLAPATPAISGASYVYEVDATDPEIKIGDTASGLTAITSGAEIVANDGYIITVVAVDSNDVVVSVGTATVVQNTTMTELEVVSEAGTQAGDTKITITPATGTFANMVDVAAQTVTLLEDVSAWTSITSGAEITATTGQYITVAEVNADGLAIGSGSAVIVSA